MIFIGQFRPAIAITAATLSLVFAGVPALRAAGPFMTILPTLESEGVFLIPASAPEARGVTPSSRNELESDLLKYAVVLQNTTDRAIIANYVCWKFTDFAGKVTTGTLTGQSFPTGESIPPHGSKFLSLDPGVGSLGGGGRGVSERMTDLWVRSGQRYRSQIKIEVVVQLAVFDDGLAVGPDEQQRFPKLKAWMDGERDFTKAALAKGEAQSFTAWIRETREHALAELSKSSPNVPKSVNSLFVATEKSADYSTCYMFVLGYLAFQASDWIDQTGAEAARKALERISASKSYPQLHRKGETQ